MKPINLNRKLTLEQTARTPDGAGGYVETWTVLGTLWADISARTGRETAGETVSLSKTGFRIVVRSAPFGAPSRPVAGQRFRDGARVFAINSVAEQDSGQRFLTCFCDEEVVV